MSDQQNQNKEIQDLSYRPINIIERFIRQTYPIYTQMYLPTIVVNDLRDCITALLKQYIYLVFKSFNDTAQYSGEAPSSYVYHAKERIYAIIKSACAGKGYMSENNMIHEARNIMESYTIQLTENEHHSKPSNQA